MVRGAVNGLDEWLYRAIYGGDDVTTLTRVVFVITLLGSGWIMVLAGPFIAIPRTRRVALALTAATIVQSVLVWATKLLLSRPRPFRALGTHPPFSAPTDFSFPSGHASGSFCVAVFFATLFLSSTLRGRRVLATAALLVASAIALSRVYLGVHYPGDVTGGAVIGGSCGFFAARLLLRARAKDRARTESTTASARL